MNKTLSLAIPENIYETLAEVAKKRGQTSEEFTLQWLVMSLEYFVNDPLEPFIGIINSQGSDWAEQHDRYLGQTLLNTHEPH